jgi:membrane-bound serine protease (ClpP class)
MILIKSPWPEASIHLPTALSVALPLGAITVILLQFAIVAKRRKAVTGEAGMIGLIGVAQTDLDPTGEIRVHGELWKARTSGRIPEGSRVRVREIEGLTLVVESAPETR